MENGRIQNRKSKKEFDLFSLHFQISVVHGADKRCCKTCRNCDPRNETRQRLAYQTKLKRVKAIYLRCFSQNAAILFAASRSFSPGAHRTTLKKFGIVKQDPGSTKTC